MADVTTDSIGSPVPGHYGPLPAGVAFAEATFAAAWNVQGDLARPPFADTVRRLFDVALPATPNTTVRSAALTALWLGPTSWLLVATAPATLTAFPAQRDALNAGGGALFDVSASCLAWTLSGPRAATVLAKDCPLDFHPRAFAVGACAQSVLGHANALICRRDPSSFTLVVARSYARGVWRTLSHSAAQYGYDVLAPRPF